MAVVTCPGSRGQREASPGQGEDRGRQTASRRPDALAGGPGAGGLSEHSSAGRPAEDPLQHAASGGEEGPSVQAMYT